VAADVRDPAQMQGLVERAVDEYGQLDIWVNNAGGTPRSDPVAASSRFHQAIIDLNLTAPLNAAMAAFRVMRDQRQGGTIIFISSVSAGIGGPEVPAYSAAKAGINNLVVALAGTFAPTVRVNAVEVGLVATPDSGDFYPSGSASFPIPMGRMGTPADVGNACLLLADPGLGAFITGAVLACHGGSPLPAP
jgi:NAD(P)-dependent dehydrogenase (short-subunit alcohol dehydrogenase family)